MTIRATFEQFLISRGMFPDQAKTVVGMLIEDPDQECMSGRWDDESSDYPQAMVIALRMCLERKALEWIDAELPLAWYRPLFAKGAAIDKAEEGSKAGREEVSNV